MTAKQRLRAKSPFAKGRLSATRTKANKRKAMQAAIKSWDWRRLKQVPNAERRHRSRAERLRLDANGVIDAKQN